MYRLHAVGRNGLIGAIGDMVMVAEQKRAWIIAGIAVVAFAGFLVLIPLVGVILASAAFGVFGLAGLAPLLFRKKSDPAEVSTDERDKMITEKATLGGGGGVFPSRDAGLPDCVVHLHVRG